MKVSKALDEVHEIMEQIYEQDKGLGIKDRVKKIRAGSDKFMTDHKLKLRRVKPLEQKPEAA